MEGLGYSSTFLGASEIPATERNIITNSHGRRLVTISRKRTYAVTLVHVRLVPIADICARFEGCLLFL